MRRSITERWLYRLVLIPLAALGARGAFAQLSISGPARLVNVIEVSDHEDQVDLTMVFNCSMRFVTSLPASEGRQVHIQLAPMPDCGVSPLSQLLAEYSRYFASGEINSEVRDQAEATARVREVFAGRPGISTDELDGLTVSADNWWFNLRPSNTEPLLRLNAEADTEAAMAALRDEVLGVVADAAKSTTGE